MSGIPKTSWQTLALDKKGPFPCKTKLLVLINYRSQYPVVTSMKTRNSENITKSLENIFTIWLSSKNHHRQRTTPKVQWVQDIPINSQHRTPHCHIILANCQWWSGEVQRNSRKSNQMCSYSRKKLEGWTRYIFLEYRSTPHPINQCDIMSLYKFKSEIPAFREK